MCLRVILCAFLCIYLILFIDCEMSYHERKRQEKHSLGRKIITFKSFKGSKEGPGMVTN